MTRKAKQSKGEGGNLQATRGDLLLIKQALTNGWDIKPHIMADLPAMLDEWIRDTSKEDRVRMRAIECVIKMVAQNKQQPNKQTNILNVAGDFYD